jgi:hypothetical protein
LNRKPKDGYLFDYITGQEIKAGKEELEAVQPFVKMLVEDYKYPKTHIITRPQYRVKVRPSDNKKSYPVDIAVFNSERKQDNELSIIVECKQPNSVDGRSQLENYLTLSSAQLGVWFNGNERLFIRKFIQADGQVIFEDIPNIPKYGQNVDDIGKYKRKDLQATHNLKTVFRAIRNHLAANTVGTTRDEVLAQQLINLIFCKIYDERFTMPEDEVRFRAGINEDATIIFDRVLKLFEDVKRKYKEVVDQNDRISLDANSVKYVVGELQNYCLIDAERDVVSDAFETFIGQTLKGAQGQFFTPRNVVQMMVKIIDPSDEDTIIDPTCGTGGFLVESLRYVWTKLDKDGERYNWSANNLQEEKLEFALNKICGIDKDYFLAKVTKAYMAMLGDGKSGIFCEDSLEEFSNWSAKTKVKIGPNKFSVLLGNPPFGSKIPVRGESKLKQFDLGHSWKKNKKSGVWEKGKLKSSEAPQILFIERNLQLLRDYGRMAVVFPDGVFGNETFSYVREWLKNKGRILAIIDVPIETFQPNTTTKTSILVFQKLPIAQIPEDYDIFMAIAETCGHDRRGNSTDSDDIVLIADKYHQWLKQQDISYKGKD